MPTGDSTTIAEAPPWRRQPAGRLAGAARVLLRALFVAAAWGAVAFAIAVPLLRTSPEPQWVTWGTLSHVLASPFCHQEPARCFHLHGCSMPICARCFGVGCGAALATLLFMPWPRDDLPRLRRWFFAAAALMAVDVALNYAGLYKLDWLRWFTGVMLGSVSGLLILQGIGSIGAGPRCVAQREVSSCSS